MSKTNKPYKCMYCGERYPTLSHVSICPCDKFSNIPPSENTGNKTVATGEQVGVVDSVGEALFNTLEISLLRQVFNSFDLMSLPANFEAGSQLFALKQKIDLLHFKNFPKGV